jgi:ketosteroid isomerase-like protein
MSEENVEIVRRIFAAWDAGDFAAPIPYDPHVLFMVSREYPEFGVFVGPEGVREYMRRFLAQWEQWTVEAQKLEAIGDTVLARTIQRGRFRATGIEAEMPGFLLFTFRGGKIIRMDTIMSESEARKAAGLSE